MRILFLADQPWQLKLVKGIIRELQNEVHSIKPTIALVDIFTFLHASEEISRTSEELGVEVLTLEKEFVKWQKMWTKKNANDEKFLKDWEDAYVTDRSLAELERSNQWIYGFENEVFYKRTNNRWKRRFLVDSIKWCDILVTDGNFDMVFSVERATLPVNILWSVCSKLEIPFVTLFHSRIQYNWILQDNFGFGTSEKILEISNSKLNSIKNSDTEKFLEFFHKSRIGSYESFEHRIDLAPTESKAQILKEVKVELRKFIGRVWARIFLERRNIRIRIRRFEQNLFKLSLFDLKIIFFNQLVKNRIVSIAGDKKTEEYFFWALHARPEGSVQALSGGVDEISLLKEFASMLPDGIILNVKENALMIGRRKFGFYRDLNSLKNVNVVGLSENTYELITNARGVVGLTGTVLLESAILKIPCFTFANPEFKAFIYSPEVLPARDFIRLSMAQDLPVIHNSIYGYLSYCLSSGVNAPLYDFDDFRDGLGLRAVKEISSKLMKFF